MDNAENLRSSKAPSRRFKTHCTPVGCRRLLGSTAPRAPAGARPGQPLGGITPPHTRGFTLLEVLVALTVISIALLAIYRLHAQSIALNNNIRFYTTAPLLAQFKAAEVQMTPADELGDGSGDFDQSPPGYSWRVSVNDVQSEYLGELSRQLKKIDIAIALNTDEFVFNISFYQFAAL